MSGSGGNDRYDVFFSYARADSARAEAVMGALRAQGLEVWFDKSHVESFESITRAIRDGVARSKIFLALYSATYPTRRACQLELASAYLAAQREGDPRRRVLAINPEADSDHIQPLKLRDAQAPTVPATQDASALGALATTIAKRVLEVEGELGGIHRLIPPRWLGIKPRGATRFVGRVPDLWALHSALHASDAAIITGQSAAGLAHVRGMGGIGKSMLAMEYALRFGAAYPGGIFWLRAYGHDDSKRSMNAGDREAERLRQIREFAAALGVPQAHGEAEMVLARQIEQRAQPCLWVVDDLPSDLGAEELDHWIAPHPLAKTLVTTRCRTYGDLGTPLDLAVLSEDEAYRLLTSHREAATPADEEAARGLVQDLGCHALAVDVAGSALATQSGLQTFGSFRASIAQAAEDTLELAAEMSATLPTGHERSISATFQTSMGLLGDEGRDFLRLAAVLAPAPIPLHRVPQILMEVDGHEYPDDEELSRQGDLFPEVVNRQVARAVAQVTGLSLAERDQEEEEALTVHTLISRTFQQADTDFERQRAMRDAAVKTMAAYMLVMPLNPHLKDMYALEIAHARWLTRVLDTVADVDLLQSEADYDLVRGAEAQALSSTERAASAFEELLGEGDPRTVNALIQVAGLLGKAGEHDKAEAIAERLAHIKTSPPELTTRARLETLHIRAARLATEGKVAEAGELLETVLETGQRELGTAHALVHGAAGSLARLRYMEGNFAEARRLQESLLYEWVPKERLNQTRIVKVWIDLGRTLRALGEKEEALRVFESTLARCLTVFGLHLPETLWLLNSYAVLLAEKGRQAEAAYLFEAVLKAKDVDWKQHVLTLQHAEAHATGRRSQRDYADALRLQQAVVDVASRSLGDGHEATVEFQKTLRKIRRSRRVDLLIDMGIVLVLGLGLYLFMGDLHRVMFATAAGALGLTLTRCADKWLRGRKARAARSLAAGVGEDAHAVTPDMFVAPEGE